MNVRKTVFLSLLSCAENGRYSNLEADAVLSRSGAASASEKSFYTSLFYGTIEKQITLDHQIAKLTEAPVSRLQTKVLILLRLGLTQLLFMDGVPDHAAISETVALAKELVNKGAVGFINAVLRNAQRSLKNEKGEVVLKTPDRGRDICGYLSVTYSYPRYLCKLWIKAYGEERAEEIMRAQNARHALTLRVNTLKTSRDALLSELTEGGMSAAASELTDDGINVRSASVKALPHFDEGHFFVQDDASRIAVGALEPRPGDTVIDACACPGGKSFVAAILMKNTGKVLSFDVHENKLSLIKSGADRLGISIISTYCADSSVKAPSLTEIADKVICDVPCSGFGTISKKPDLRLKDKESVSALPELQYKILSTCSDYVKRGGTLLYSTCTLNPAENEDNVGLFLREHGDFELREMKTLFPSERSDGFFFAVMTRKTHNEKERS